jgi:TRAP-type C4-dicarboxylate transport system permease large subunit
MNTMRQLGAVLGSAAVGAVLQIQIVSHLAESARANADALPLSMRPRFMEGFEKAAAARNGLEVGVGQTGSHLPDNIPFTIRPAIEQVAQKTFYEAYIPAMRTTLLLPLVVLALALIAALLVRRRPEDEDEQERPTDS